MKSGLKIISLTVLMLIGCGHAIAGPFGRERAPQMRQQRPPPRMNQQEQRAAQQEQRRAEQPPPPRQQGQFNPGNGGGNPFMGQANDPRRAGQRMSAEERQRLRRQINEAGQDIYQKR